MMMSPWWSREAMDYCYSSGSRTCEGVWYRTLPYDGQGKTVTADITDDTTGMSLTAQSRSTQQTQAATCL